MEKTALAQEKVWFDKPSYDKAERLYFERMAKVVSDKIMGSCTLKSEISVISNRQDITNINPLPKTKSEKSKDNKSLISESISNDILKNSKRQVKFSEVNEIEDDCNVPRKKNLKEKQNDGEKNNLKEKKTNPLDDTSKKYSAKELKGQKNKADTKHSNEHKGKNGTKQVKGNTTLLFNSNSSYLPPHQRNQQTASPILSTGGSLANEVAKARQHIKQSLQCIDDIATVAGVAVPNEIKKESIEESKAYQELKAIIEKLEERVRALEEKFSSTTSCAKVVVCPAAPAPAPKQQSEKAEDEDDVDLFGSDSEGEDAEAAKIREERLAAYNAKKSKKPALIAKSNIIFDVKPWDDETDMKEMETMVRQIETDGLLWGAAKLVPLAYGIHKLQISCVVEDDKVSVDWLTEKIQEFEDFVQSVDIAAFNKV